MKNYKSSEPCLCCGLISENMVCYHHIYTRKSRPDLSDEKWNLMPLCLTHHNDVHMQGLIYMSDKFNRLKKWLISNNWSIEDGKWKNEAASKV